MLEFVYINTVTMAETCCSVGQWMWESRGTLSIRAWGDYKINCS